MCGSMALAAPCSEIIGTMPTPTDPKLAQLRHALAQGVIDQATFDAATAGIQAQLTGSGPIAG